MSALASGLDMATQDMVLAAGIMIDVADVFPDCIPIGKLMPWGSGGPGSMAEGARSWGDGADALQQAQQALTQTCAGLGTYDWSGDDRQAFDQKVSELAAQLGDAHNYAMMVGATLAALSAPLAAYGPVCLGVGGVMLAEAIAFDAAVASVVGNLGASEAIWAEGCAAAGVCLTVIAAYVGTLGTLMEAAAAVIVAGDVIDVHEQQKNGDESAASDFKQAQIDGLGEVAKNVESWGVGIAADAAGDKVHESVGGEGLADKAIASLIGKATGKQIENDNKGAVDLATGADPLTTITDTLGLTEPIKFVQESTEEVAEKLPDNLGDLINEGVNWRDHS